MNLLTWATVKSGPLPERTPAEVKAEIARRAARSASIQAQNLASKGMK
jgi:hypothetical protein